MSDLNSSLSNSNTLNETFLTAEDFDYSFIETSGSSVFSLDSIKISETFSQSSSYKCDTAGIGIDKCTSNWKAGSGINISENVNLTEFGGTDEIFKQCPGAMSSDFINIVNDTEIKEEEFCEGFQVSDDPFFLNSVENSGKVDSETLDSENNAFKSRNLFKYDCNVEIFNQNSGVMSTDFINIVNDFEIKDKDFSNGFQVFNDPTFLNFFENSKSSNNVEESLMYRSSLYKNFDPLCTESLTEPNLKSVVNDIEIKDKDFSNGFQAFNDPNFLNFFENSKSSSNVQESLMYRSSLYRDFDPLCTKSLTVPNLKSIELRETAVETDFEHGNLSILYSDNLKERKSDKNKDVKFVKVELIKIESNECNVGAENNVAPLIQNKSISNASEVPSLGNNLISFDLPAINDICSNFETDGSCISEKLYSEEEFKQTLKIQERLLKEKYMREQQALKEMFSKQQQKLDAELRQRKLLSNGILIVIKETGDIALSHSEKITLMKNKLELIENENKELKIDLNKSLEYFKKIEKAFSNLFDKYVECKNLVKKYIENERELVQQLELEKVKLCERETTKGIKEPFAKSNTELEMERNCDNQVEMLKMQIHGAEVKISISEKNLKLLKTENEKLNFTCNDLMSKVYKI